MTVLYTSIVRPVLEYGCPVWAPWHQKDINLLESVQSKALKLCRQNVQLESLQHRRDMLDLCETYKIMHGFYRTPADSFFSRPYRNIGGHQYKIFKRRSRLDIRKNYFSNRVVDAWNRLPIAVVTAPSLTAFKTKLRSLPPV